MSKRVLASQIMIPIIATRPLSVTSESVSVPAGAAGTIKDFYFARKPILDSHSSWIGGFGDTSITGIGTVFTNEVAAYTPDSLLANGDYWIDYVTGRGRGKKATTGTSLTVSYKVAMYTGDLSAGGTVDGDLDVTGDFSVSGAFSVGSLVTDTIVIDADNVEALLVRKNGDAGDVLAVDTVDSQLKLANGTSLLPSYAFINDPDTGLYRKAANTIGFVANAAEIGSWTTGLLTLATGHVAYAAGVAVTAASYSVGRDADATNQLHLNVPTGATFEFSVNDTPELVLSATELNLKSNQLTWDAGSALTAGSYQIGRDNGAVNVMTYNVPTSSGHLFTVQGTAEFGITAAGAFIPQGNSLRVHNLADTITNTESIYFDWAANIARIYTFPTGTGTQRTLSISAFNSSSGGGTISLSASTPFVRLTHSTTGIAGSLVGYDATSTATSSTTNFFYITPSVNQSGTAGYNALVINPNESTVGSGTRNFVSFQTSSTERFGVRVSGDVNHAPVARTTAVQPIGYTYTGAAHTGLSNAIYRDFYINNNRSVQFAGGGAAIQYACGVEITPISFAAASAQSVSIIAGTIFTGAALAGTNLTATYQATRYAVFGQGKSANLVTDAVQMPGIETSVGAMTSIHGYAVHAGQSNTNLGNQTATLDRLSAFYNDAITYESATNTRTVTEAAGAYFNAPIAGTNVSFTTVYGAIVKTGSFKISAGRLATAKGADVASANDLTLGSDGNSFTITGTTQINAILMAGWAGGAPVILYFSNVVTVKHNTAGGAGTAPILLSGSADFVTAANSVLVLSFDGTNWQELSRKAA